MRINQVTTPQVEGNTFEQTVVNLCEHCHEAAVRFMKLNNDFEDLKQKVADMERNQS